jgi:hypothetical protein
MRKENVRCETSPEALAKSTPRGVNDLRWNSSKSTTA